MLRKFLVSYLWIALVVTGLVVVADQKILPEPGTWNLLELQSLDWRFFLRKPPTPNAAQDIALIVIDEQSYKTINQPLIFYHTHIAAVIDYLVRSGARVIGLDVELPSISLESRVSGGYDSIYTRALLRARKQGVDVVVGFSSGANPPLPVYLAAAGRENLAAFTLSPDRDDFIRRQQWRFGAGDHQYYSFAYLLAAKFAGREPSPPGPVILIDYSLAGRLPLYSFHQVYAWSLRAEQPENPFKGKVVLIGTLFSFEDRHATPLSRFPGGEGKRTAGVVIQAVTLATLLSGIFFREPGSFLGGVLIFGAALAGVICCYRRRPLAGALWCLAPVVTVVVASVVAFSQAYIIRLVPLLAAILLAYAFTTICHYYTEERRRLKIRERFAAFVPETVIDRLVDMDVNRLLEGEQRQVALMFADIRGFTAFAEQHSRTPQKIINFLNRYHTEMTDIILAHHGTVSQLTGDGIFAFFGAPVPVAEPVLGAVQAALGMRARVAQLSAVWQEFGMEELRIGIGIHVGLAIVGAMGSLKKMDYTAIGDNTNVASRIEGLTKDFHEVILMSGEAYRQVQDRVAARSLGPAQIKGHRDVDLYALDGLRI
jgi:adenylate cyclase